MIGLSFRITILQAFKQSTLYLLINCSKLLIMYEKWTNEMFYSKSLFARNSPVSNSPWPLDKSTDNAFVQG